MNIKIYFVQFFRLASHTLGQALLSDIILMVQLYRSFFLSFSVVAPLCSVEVHLLYIWIKRKICSYPPLPLFWLKQHESSCFFRGNMNPLLLCLILLGRQNRLWNEQSARSKKGKLEEIEINLPNPKQFYDNKWYNYVNVKSRKISHFTNLVLGWYWSRPALAGTAWTLGGRMIHSPQCQLILRKS